MTLSQRVVLRGGSTLSSEQSRDRGLRAAAPFRRRLQAASAAEVATSSAAGSAGERGRGTGSAGAGLGPTIAGPVWDSQPPRQSGCRPSAGHGCERQAPAGAAFTAVSPWDLGVGRPRGNADGGHRLRAVPVPVTHAPDQAAATW